MKIVSLFLASIALAVTLTSCSSNSEVDSSAQEISFAELESKYLQEIASMACVQLMGTYDLNQLGKALKYFRILEIAVGGPWAGITSELLAEGTSSGIYRSRCLG